MKWKKRQREIKRLRAAHAGKKWRNPFPDLSTGDRKISPCSNRFDSHHNHSGEGPKAPQPVPPGMIVDHFHKSGLQVILPSELPWAGGKKP